MEIGVWEGRSTCWLLETILTHPESILITVDPFEYNQRPATSEENEELRIYKEGHFDLGPIVETRFYTNLGELAKKVIHHKKSSDQFFADRGQPQYDIVIVDGAHNAFQVAKDLLNSWQFLKPGGILIADDYGWTGHFDVWKCNGPRRALDAFMSIIPGDDYEVLFKDWIIIFRKKFGA